MHSLKVAAFTALFAATFTASAEDHLEDRVKELEEQVEALVGELENNQSSSASSNSRTTIGGYGELHYNNIDDNTNQIDAHRFVLFFGHEFNESTRFVGEFELEHALAKDTADGSGPGEVELEQMYIEFDITDHSQVKGGIFLVPVGILNETHEPPTFYGVERNPIEKNIIPTTWWEGGAMYSQQFESGLSYDVAFHSGLEVPGSLSIRSGRQKVAEATADKGALTGRIKYTGIQGLELAATIQSQADISQAAGDDIEGATLIEAHAIFNKGNFGARILHASWDIDGALPEAAGKDKQDGNYAEVSYKFTEKFGVFARQNNWSVTDGVDSKQSDFGFNYWPHPDVVIKFDIQEQNDDAGDKDGFNVGIGYQF